jgi:hypothetical protein
MINTAPYLIFDECGLITRASGRGWVLEMWLNLLDFGTVLRKNYMEFISL